MSQLIVSSDQLATTAGVNSAKVRKDLSYLSPRGTRGVGYDVEELKQLIAVRLGRTAPPVVAIVGAGNLGQALAGYDGFVEHGFTIAALFDTDQAKVGKTVGGTRVYHLDELDEIVAGEAISIGMITTPEGAAQEVANRLAAAGVRSILNFAPAILKVPEGVEVRRVDLSTELQILSYYLNVDRDEAG
jgi:redox-sensing transcriptional repressor